MDFIFQLDAAQRASYFHQIFHSFGFTYISLWSYHTSNCLVSLDGFYREDNGKASSSSGTLGRRLFDEYRQLNIAVKNDHVPGLAFMRRQPFMELKALQLQTLASAEAQRQFYQEARIQVAVFMGCNAGEVELGMSYDTQVDLETEMRILFRLDSSQQAPPARELPHPANEQNWATSSSSSSLRSLSPELSPFLLNIPSTSYLPEPSKEAHPAPPLNPTPSSINPLHQAMQAFGQIRNPQLPNPVAEEAAITQAILAVLSCSSPHSSSSSSHQIITPPNMPPHNRTRQNLANAFKKYNRSELVPSLPATRIIRRQNMFKRSLAFLRTLNLMRTQESAQGRPYPTSQSLHVMSERKRREKLNQSFQALRSLLPPGTKKDKASMLAATTEYLASLRAQVAALCQRNQSLEARLSPENEVAENQLVGPEPSTERPREKQLMGERSNESPSVQLTRVQDSTSEEALVMSLEVTMREGQSSLLDLMIRVLEFLKQVKNVGLLSVEGDTMVVDSSSISRGVFVLKIEGGEWDESAFREAVRRVVAELA